MWQGPCVGLTTPRVTVEQFVSTLKKYVSRVAELGCIICGRPAEIHHVPPLRRPRGCSGGPHRDDRYILPLCEEHHRLGPMAVHGGREVFEANYGTEAELLKVVEKRLESSIWVKVTEILNRTSTESDGMGSVRKKQRKGEKT